MEMAGAGMLVRCQVVAIPFSAGVKLMLTVWKNSMLEWCWQGVPVGKLGGVLTCDWNGWVPVVRRTHCVSSGCSREGHKGS